MRFLTSLRLPMPKQNFGFVQAGFVRNDLFKFKMRSLLGLKPQKAPVRQVIIVIPSEVRNPSQSTYLIKNQSKKAFIIFLLMLLHSIFAFSQEKNDSTKIYNTLYDREYYSQCLGFQIDTICNIQLFETVTDWIKTPYKYAGKTKTGVDCSDFVSVVYDSAYRIPLSGGADLIFTKTIPIEKGELKECDLVFFKIKKKTISHVGIYLTKNKFAHASVNAGVVVSDLDEDYYKKYFFKGGRVKTIKN